MIPLRDSVRPQKYPFVNILFIVLNIAVFAYQLGLEQEQLLQLYHDFGVIPRRFLDLLGETLGRQLWLPVASSMFLHGGWLHLLGNMLYLWVFGDNVEDRFGHGGYILFYLFSGTAASLVHIAMNPLSDVPTIGASGAVAGVLGAYLVLFPRARVLTLVPIGFFLTTIHLPAMLFLFFWFLIQLINAGLLAGFATSAQAVAWWAHIGGFIAGLGAALLLLILRKIGSLGR